jgi:hypothetical protein
MQRTHPARQPLESFNGNLSDRQIVIELTGDDSDIMSFSQYFKQIDRIGFSPAKFATKTFRNERNPQTLSHAYGPHNASNTFEKTGASASSAKPPLAGAEKESLLCPPILVESL